MPPPLKLYAGPAQTPNLPRVSLWGADPGSSLVLFDDDAQEVIGMADPSIEVDSSGLVTVGGWVLGPEVILSDLPSQPWTPAGPSAVALGGAETVRVFHSSTRLVLIPRPPGDPLEAVTVPFGRLETIGSERMAVTWWGELVGYVASSGCRPCMAAAAKSLGLGK